MRDKVWSPESHLLVRHDDVTMACYRLGVDCSDAPIRVTRLPNAEILDDDVVKETTRKRNLSGREARNWAADVEERLNKKLKLKPGTIKVYCEGVAPDETAEEWR